MTYLWNFIEKDKIAQLRFYEIVGAILFLVLSFLFGIIFIFVKDRAKNPQLHKAADRCDEIRPKIPVKHFEK